MVAITGFAKAIASNMTLPEGSGDEEGSTNISKSAITWGISILDPVKMKDPFKFDLLTNPINSFLYFLWSSLTISPTIMNFTLL